MKTKALLIAAATLAVGVLSSNAQVYSQNIVGYVNLNAKSGGATPMSTPLDVVDSNSITNAATNVLQNPFNPVIGNGPLDASTLLVYTATGFKTYYFDANPADAVALGQTFTGITDAGGNFIPGPVLGNGKGYYLIYSQITGFPATNTATIVGNVRNTSSVSTVISNTVVIPGSPLITFVASGLPIAGGVLTDLGLTNLLAAGVLDGNNIQVPVILNGVAHGYTTYYFDSNPADATSQGQAFTGVTDASGSFLPQPIIPVGGNFLFVNQNAVPLTWSQVITNN